MDIISRKEILQHVDHTLLAPTATWEELQILCDEAIKYETASVCVPPNRVKQVKDYLCGRMAVCTVVGFPNGYHTTAVKAMETEEVLDRGADEVDMVINLGWVKEKRFHDVQTEIHTLKDICDDKILKVIVETCFLTQEEKIKMCEVVTEAGADFIKTSTGFGAAVQLLRMWRSLPHMLEKMSGSRQPAVLAVLRMQSISLSLVHQDSGQAG